MTVLKATESTPTTPQLSLLEFGELHFHSTNKFYDFCRMRVSADVTQILSDAEHFLTYYNMLFRRIS